MRADLIPVGAAGASVVAKIRPAREGRPWILFLSGYRSSMEGEKARAIDALAGIEGWGFARFDYRGHGRTGGLVDAHLVSEWVEDSLAVLDFLPRGEVPVILVGSSMGAWIAVHVALGRRDRIGALVGIACAPDFTRDLIEAALQNEDWRTLVERGYVERPSRYGESPDRYTRAFIEDGRSLSILQGPIALDLPTRLIHGMADRDVPWRQSLRLTEALAGRDVTLTLVKDGDHRLSRPGDLDLIRGCVRDAVSACAEAIR